MKRPPDAPVAVRAWVRLLEVHKLALGEMRDEQALGVTLPRFDLLANLDAEDGLTLAALSRRMLVTAGNLTGLVDRAERDGLVAREADGSDRRLTRVRLSPQGRTVYREAKTKHDVRVESLFAPLTGAEREGLSVLLGKLRAHLRNDKKGT